MLRRDRLDQAWPDAATVDPREIERFTALAADWWNPGGRFRRVHEFNAVRRDYILSRIAEHFGRSGSGHRPLAGLTVLDVGCGAGLLCEPLSEAGAKVLGIDATARNVEIARWHASGTGLSVDYRHCLAEHVLAAGERFDVVLNTEVIEHVADQTQLMADCAALVRPGGLMIVATLNRTLRALLVAIIGAEYVLKWLPKGTHDWRRFVRPSEIQSMIAPHGLVQTDTAGVSFRPVGNRWRLTNDTSVNYIMSAVKTAAAVESKSDPIRRVAP